MVKYEFETPVMKFHDVFLGRIKGMLKLMLSRNATSPWETYLELAVYMNSLEIFDHNGLFE